MDIVVTIPKHEYKNDDLETVDMLQNNLVQFWTLKKKPKHLKIGDRVYKGFQGFRYKWWRDI